VHLTFTTESGGGAYTPPTFEPIHHPSFAQHHGAGQPIQPAGTANMVAFLPWHPVLGGRPGGGTGPGNSMINSTRSGFGGGGANPSGGGCGACDDCPKQAYMVTGGGEGEVYGAFGFDDEGRTVVRTQVSLHNGAFVHRRVDWAYPDRSGFVTFTRTYRSNLADPSTGLAFQGLFGYRTISNWETRVIGFSGTGTAFTLLSPDGRLYPAAPTGSAWTLPAGFLARTFYDGGSGLLKVIFQNGVTRILFPRPEDRGSGAIVRRDRLGGLFKFYRRAG
jgi:hypothetical protein